MLDNGAIGHVCGQAQLGRHEPCDIHLIDEEVECLMDIWDKTHENIEAFEKTCNSHGKGH